MRYLPKSPAEREQMLAEIGARSIDDLFAVIPAEYRLTRDLDVPRQQAESEIISYFKAAGQKDATDYASFLGAGAYRHYRPVIIDSLVQRGEFLTSYTPYQAEMTQGTLQAIFEFQSYVCQLTELDVANASLYDGATAVVEAVLMAARTLPGRRRAVVAGALHPDWRAVLATYCEPMELAITDVAWGGDGRVDLEALAHALGDDVCAVVVASPNALGVIEDLPALARAIAAAGALGVHAVAEATSLGMLAPGGRFGFDVVCGELQAFGIPAAFGGPLLGFFAARQQHLRQMPGRLIGETADAAGRRGYVLTLSTREQHIRRAKATSNICTNHGLMALAATIVISLLGKKGVREVALASHAKAEYVKTGLRAQGAGRRVQLAFPDSPTYDEFLVLHDDPDGLLARLKGEGILGGVSTTRFGTGWPRGILIAATERNTREECGRLLGALGRLA